MRLVALYHFKGEHAGALEAFARQLNQDRPNIQLDLEDLESPSGANLAQLYGINTYPAILLTSEDGSLIRLWQGLPLPLISELSSYLA